MGSISLTPVGQFSMSELGSTFCRDQRAEEAIPGRARGIRCDPREHLGTAMKLRVNLHSAGQVAMNTQLTDPASVKQLQLDGENKASNCRHRFLSVRHDWRLLF
jgi:hypothetical protein